MRITDLLGKSPEIRDNEHKGYEMVNDGSTEIEIGEFLYGLVRVVKPTAVLETGTYKGVSSAYIADALKRNKNGYLDTLEYESKHIEEAKLLWNSLGVSEQITSHLISSLDFIPSHAYQIIFLDTEPGIRFAEFIKYYHWLDDGGFIGIHDLPRNLCQGNINPDHPEILSWPFGQFPKELQELVTLGKLHKFHLPNPRGMVWWYKSTKDDFHV